MENSQYSLGQHERGAYLFVVVCIDNLSELKMQLFLFLIFIFSMLMKRILDHLPNQEKRKDQMR